MSIASAAGAAMMAGPGPETLGDEVTPRDRGLVALVTNRLVETQRSRSFLGTDDHDFTLPY
jgi:hypothetical protein